MFDGCDFGLTPSLFFAADAERVRAADGQAGHDRRQLGRVVGLRELRVAVVIARDHVAGDRRSVGGHRRPPREERRPHAALRDHVSGGRGDRREAAYAMRGVPASRTAASPAPPFTNSRLDSDTARTVRARSPTASGPTSSMTEIGAPQDPHDLPIRPPTLTVPPVKEMAGYILPRIGRCCLNGRYRYAAAWMA